MAVAVGRNNLRAKHSNGRLQAGAGLLPGELIKPTGTKGQRPHAETATFRAFTFGPLPGDWASARVDACDRGEVARTIEATFPCVG